MNDNVIYLTGAGREPETIETMDVHKKLSDAIYYVVLAVDGDNTLEIITNLQHLADVQSVMAEALEELDGNLVNPSSQ